MLELTSIAVALYIRVDWYKINVRDRMKNIHIKLIVLLLLSDSFVVRAVDQTSNAYQMGNLAGKIFLIILLLLIIKKLFFNKK